MSTVSQQTYQDMCVVLAFFGTELEHNRHIFRAAADHDHAAFAITMSGLAAAIRRDPRHGINQRIRQDLAHEQKSGGKPNE